MCGILFLVPAVVGPAEGLSISKLKPLERRGPDLSNSVFINFKCATETRGFAFCSVLSHQGTIPFPQPVWIEGSENSQERFRYLLLWNGEAYCHEKDTEVPSTKSDTELIVNSIGNTGGRIEDILTVFQHLNGPFAFVLIQPKQKRIFFGRDRFGRRSLVCKLTSRLTSLECISSLVPFEEPADEMNAKGDTDSQWFEVPASGIYTALLDDAGYFGFENWYPWSGQHQRYWTDCSLHKACQLASEAGRYPPVDRLCYEPSQEDHVSRLLRLLSAAVKVRVRHSARTCQHCAPSADCSHARIGVLFSGGLDSAVLAVLADRYVPPDQPIDLITVAFEHLKGSSNEGRTRKARQGQEPVSQQTEDLSPQLASPACAPDRLTALSTFEELKQLAPHRRWHLVLVDVTLAELKVARQRRIRCLLKPSPLTTLNENLAVAIWFAARGKGCLVTSSSGHDATETPPYNSPAKILLVGTGADEQLAGYSRHRTAFSRGGAEAVRQELEIEMMRIGERNLGRDDRMISDHGREARFPFLDEAVVQFLSALPVSEKADFSLPRGQGEKRLLRLAALQMGLCGAAALPKRAMQFGTRIAKTEHTNAVHGADRNLYVDDLE